MLGLFEFGLGDRPRDDAGARVDMRLAVLQDRATDGDGRVEVAVVAEVADRAAVEAASLAFGGGDELHRPHLRCATQRPGREYGLERIERVELGLQATLDVRHEVEHVAVALDLHVLAHGHGAGAAHPSEIVTAEIDQHHVLGPLLRILLELLGQDLVLARIDAPWPRARDRMGGQLVALRLEQELRRGADDLELRRTDEEEIWARVDAPKRSIQADAVERTPGRRVGREIERLAAGKDDLDRFAGGDRVLGDLDRTDVLVTPKARLDGIVRRPARRGARRWPAISVALGRAVRSSASKMASSAIR